MMKLRQRLILCLLLWAGVPGLTAAVSRDYLVSEGQDLTVSCPFDYLGDRYTFCRNDCKSEDILIETSKEMQQNGRYKLEYRKISEGVYKMNVTIRQLKTSDAGRYMCVMEKAASKFQETFVIKFTKETVTLGPVPSKNPRTNEHNATASLVSNINLLFLLLIPIALMTAV